jgi:iron complex transport system substrate-binding protein
VRARLLTVAVFVLGGAGALSLLVAALRHPISGALVGAAAFHPARVEGAAFPRRLVDPSGRVRVLPAPPRRIVSSYLGSDEILAVLVDRSRLAAVSIYSDDASSSNCLGAFPPPVGRVRGEPEEILALRPDLVLVTNFNDDGAVRLLEGAGVPILRSDSWDSFDGVLAHIRLLGAAVGADAGAEQLARAVERRLAAVAARVRGRTRPRVLYYEVPGYTRGAGALIDEMIERAGGSNVARDLGIRGVAELGFESVLALRPEVLVMPGFGVGPTATEIPPSLTHAAGWSEIPAVKTGRVHVIPASSITSLSQHAARGLEELARIIHPDLIERGGTEEPRGRGPDPAY